MLAGDYEIVELPTLEVGLHGERHIAVNDVLVTSAVQGRMAVLEWEVNGTNMGERGCDGIVVSTPSGSTGYNLSAGGPVLSWGVDAMVATFIAAHALDARPLVLARGHAISISSRSIGFPSRVVVDGHLVGTLDEAASADRPHGARDGAPGDPARPPLPAPLPRHVLALSEPSGGAPAGLALAAVEVVIRALEARLQVLAALPLRHAGRPAHAARGVQLHQQPQCPGAVGTRHDQHELVAALAAQQALAVELAGPHAPELGQRPVAGRVAVAVVDALEVVEVEDGDGDRLAAPVGPRRTRSAARRRPERLSQAGQRIGVQVARARAPPRR